MATTTIKPCAGKGFLRKCGGVCQFPTDVPHTLKSSMEPGPHEQMIEELNRSLRGVIPLGNVFFWGSFIWILGGPPGWLLTIIFLLASIGAKTKLGYDARNIMAKYSDKNATYKISLYWFSAFIRVTASDADPESGALDVDEEVKKPNVAVKMDINQKPIYTFEGGHLDGSVNSYWDLCDPKAGKKLPASQPVFPPTLSLARGFSFYAEIEWDAIRSWSHIFDFGHDAGSQNLLACNREREPIIGFELWSSKSKLADSPDWSADFGNGMRHAMNTYPSSSRATMGSRSCWLFVVAPAEKEMRIYKDGRLCGLQTLPAGYDASDRERTKFLIGRSWWRSETNHPHENFKGSIRDIRIWDTAVEWGRRTTDVKDDDDDDDAALPKSLLTSPSVIEKSQGKESLTRSLPTILSPVTEEMSPRSEEI